MLQTAELLFNVIYPVCAVVGFITCGYKVRDLLRGPRSAALVALVVARLWPALSFTVATPWVYRQFDQWIGIPNTATLLVYSLIVLNSVTAQVLLLLWSHPPEVARRKALPRLAACAAVLVTMTVLFVAADVTSERPVDFDVYYARTPLIAAFLIIYLAFFAIGLGTSAWMTWRFSRAVDRPWLRRGLQLNAIGALFGLGYDLAKTVSIVARWAGSSQLDAVNVIGAPVSASTGALLIAISSTLPAWGPRAEQQWRWKRAYRRLEPLWLALYRAEPSIALHPPRPTWRDRWDVRDIEYRLYRRLIEIRDGHHALRPWFRDDVAATARRDAAGKGASGEGLEAAVEAAMLIAALQARTRDEPAVGTVQPPAPPPPASDRNLDDDSSWLVAVSEAMRASAVHSRPDSRNTVG
ncbi:hypothetical protein QLQ12_11820 [Actinoplanes sp. NEAU-A12]|uniref:DUF6545 domain-containing protein n=1 Tax=Actinoplanes sandaracinus TaxID=3045177 RepID=A0ABT6WHT8_9ACTN|nr:MAB_1171c family putative transporter [Actinoplanes sandaracinus]MDI6099280.1 hypothetical protein [Actinoplanes sandaracinus]